MLTTELQYFYGLPLGSSKLTDYSFLRDYGKLDSFNENENEYVTCNIDTSLDGYVLTQGIIDTIKPNIYMLTNDETLRTFYEIILYNIERNVNAFDIAENMGIRDVEHQLNRLKAIVHMLHIDYYCHINKVRICVECRQKPEDALEDISKFNKPNGLRRLKHLLQRIKPRRISK